MARIRGAQSAEASLCLEKSRTQNCEDQVRSRGATTVNAENGQPINMLNFYLRYMFMVYVF